MSKQSDKVYLQHILENIELIENANIESVNDLLVDDYMQASIVRFIEIIGEACAQISKDLKNKYTDVPWRDATDMRNKVIHEYFDVDYDVVWDTINDDLPQLKTQIQKILSDLDSQLF